MPAHIATVNYLKAAGRFVNQALPSKYQSSNTYVTLRGRQKQGHNWISPAFAATIPEQARVRREIHCTTYDEYRTALDKFFTKGAKGYSNGEYPWFKGVGDARNQETTFERASNHLSSNSKWDTAGYQHFKNEWDLYLKKGTSLDHAVYARLATGETITLIRRSSETREHQLKRIEANTPQGTVILWSIH